MCIHKKLVGNTDHRKQRLIEAWTDTPQSVIDEAVDERDCMHGTQQNVVSFDRLSLYHKCDSTTV